MYCGEVCVWGGEGGTEGGSNPIMFFMYVHMQMKIPGIAIYQYM